MIDLNETVRVWAIVDSFGNDYIFKRTYKEIAPFLFKTLVQATIRYCNWKLIRKTVNVYTTNNNENVAKHVWL